jgi:hypothetical protein
MPRDHSASQPSRHEGMGARAEERQDEFVSKIRSRTTNTDRDNEQAAAQGGRGEIAYLAPALDKKYRQPTGNPNLWPQLPPRSRERDCLGRDSGKARLAHPRRSASAHRAKMAGRSKARNLSHRSDVATNYTTAENVLSARADPLWEYSNHAGAAWALYCLRPPSKNILSVLA